MINKKIKNKNGFVMLYAVMLSSIILAITLGVANISLKEVKFSTGAKDTNDAFFAADTGAECALFNDKNISNVFIDPSSLKLNCNGMDIVVEEPSPLYWYFILPGLGNERQGCAKVIVDKTVAPITITSKGYNNGGDSCIQGSNSIERQIEVRY